MQSPLCTGMNYSDIHEFGTAHFIVLSFSLEKTCRLRLDQGYELNHGLRALRWRWSVPSNRREAITQPRGETSPKNCLCKMRKRLKPIISFSAVSFTAGKEATFPLHLPCIPSISLSLSLSLCLACYTGTNRLAVIIVDLLSSTGLCNWTLYIALFITHTRTRLLQTARLAANTARPQT